MGLFAIFVVVRQQIKRAAGDSYEENEWGFGQVLAIGIWAPVLLSSSTSFVVIYSRSLPSFSIQMRAQDAADGRKDGLEGRLPKLWNVHIEATDNILTPEDLQPLQSSNIEDELSGRDGIDLGRMNVPPARARTT
jgi:hypothetical protein